MGHRSTPKSEAATACASLARSPRCRTLEEMKTVWRVFAYLKRYPWLAAGTLSFAILGTLMVIVYPMVTKWIIDEVVRFHHPEKLLPLVLLAAAAFLIQHGFNAIRILLK